MRSPLLPVLVASLTILALLGLATVGAVIGAATLRRRAARLPGGVR
jgi:hypothetical protein